MKKQKKFKHKEIELCALSKKSIDTSKEDYSIILGCIGDEIKSTKFYKTELLRDLIKDRGEKVIKVLQQRTQELSAGLIRGALRKVGVIKPVYEVGQQ